MTAHLVGIKHIRDEVEILPAVGAELSVIGLVGTAPAANAETFPLNSPIYFNTSNTDMVAALGTDGWLPDAVRGITDQLGVAQGAAKVVIVRTEEGDDDAETVANIMGSAGAKSGIYALLEAGEIHGVVPRIVVCEKTDWTPGNGVNAVTLLTQGSNLTEAPTVTATGGGSHPDKVLPTFTATLGSGANADKVVSIAITTPGSNLTAAPTLTFTGGGSAGGKVLPTASCTIALLASPVVASLVGVLNSLRGHAVLQGPATSYQAWLNWREAHQSDRLIPGVAQLALVQEGSQTVQRDFSPRIAGILARRDNEFDGIPGRSAANQPVYGIVGVSRRVQFALDNPNNEGGDLAVANGGFVVRGDVGLDSSLGAGGFIYWGTDNLAEDEVWRFYNVTRMRDYIELTQMRVLRSYLGRYNVDSQTIRAVINTLVSHLEGLKRRRHIIDFRVGFEADKNSPEDLRQGFLTVNFRAEEAPVLRKITINSRRYRAALDQLSNQIATQLGSVSTVQN
jgi:phage tail sheath protein FI